MRTFAYNGDLSLASESINPEGGGLYHKTIARKYEGAGAGLDMSRLSENPSATEESVA